MIGSDAEVVGLDFAGLPEGTAKITYGCGNTVPSGNDASVEVEIRALTDPAPAGGSWTFDEDAAVVAVRAGESAPDVLGCGSPYVGGSTS